MTIVKGYYDELHWTECDIESFKFIGCDLEVYIKLGLEVYGEHPLSNTHNPKKPCKVIFSDVISSVRLLNEYDKDLNFNGFKGAKRIIDKLDNKQKFGIKYEDYSIEGVWLEPKSWLTWDIIAQDFYLDDLKDK